MSKFTLDWKQYAALARQAAAEGCVLLENKNNTLPLAEGETCAVFGRTQFEYYKSGTGSGGLVNTSYVHDLDYALTESSLIIDEEVKTAYKNWLKDHPLIWEMAGHRSLGVRSKCRLAMNLYLALLPAARLHLS